MANDIDWQVLYYFLGVFGIVTGAVVAVWRWHRGVLASVYQKIKESEQDTVRAVGALSARIDGIEDEAVTVTAMKDALHDLLQRFDERWKAHTDLLAERFKRADERHEELKGGLRDLKAGQDQLASAIADLPCPQDGAHGIG